MLALILPVLLVATLIMFTLAISFFSLELLLRAVAKGLGIVPEGFTRQIRKPATRRLKLAASTQGTRLQAAWQRF